jgi:hypothetical protein
LIYCQSVDVLFFVYFHSGKFTSLPLWPVNVNRLKSFITPDFRLFSVSRWFVIFWCLIF